MAAYNARKKYNVEFIETESYRAKRTPDLLVKNQIEIECKKNDTLSHRDIKNNNNWKNVVVSSSISMNKYKVN